NKFRFKKDEVNRLYPSFIGLNHYFIDLSLQIPDKQPYFVTN
ncbi:MAG: hypothetical protein H6Q12_1225, partial [Bacteroidetes bacterium]|nr:hypothetical protein [Bacteroidota bacterium]